MKTTRFLAFAAIAALAAAAVRADTQTYERGLKIRLLFVFDAGAQDYLEGAGKDSYSLASSCVTQMNKVLENSRLTGSDNLTGTVYNYFTYELAGVTFVQARNSSTYTAWSQAINVLNGNKTEEEVSMTGMVSERSRYAADIIVMLVDTGSSGGNTGNSTPYQGTTADYAVNFAGTALSVCSVRTAELEAAGTFGQFQVCSHEVAHTLGCGHTDTQDNQASQQSSSYSYGYQFDYPGDQHYTLLNGSGYSAWYGCTVMAYKEHFFKNADGSYMTRAEALAASGWTDADEGTKFWDNTGGGYSGYGAGVFNYCNQLPYFSSPDLCFVMISGEAATVVPTTWATAHYDAGTYVPMGDETHNNRQVLIDNYQYASRWHLGVKFSKSGDAGVVNGADDKISLAALSDNCTIYYTTDGTEPTSSNGTQYAEPFSLVQAATVKARAYDAQGNAGDVIAKEYTMLPLAVALGNTELTWTSSSPAWYVSDGVARSGSINSDGVTSTLATVITGPATLTFEYATALMDSDVLEVRVGGETVLTATDYNTDFRSSGEIAIPDGEQTVEFSFTVNFNMGGFNHAQIRNVTLTTPEPPAVVPGTVSQETMAQSGVELDESGEWAVVGDAPIFFTVPSETNVFTVAFDAYIPVGEGAIFGFSVKNNAGTAEIRARRMGDGTVKGTHTGTTTMGNNTNTTGGDTVVASGLHSVAIEYSHENHNNSSIPASIYGTTIYIDGVKVYHSGNLRWNGRVTTLFAIGGAAISGTATDVLTGLKVKNLTFIDGLFKDRATGEDAFATLNGVAAGSQQENLSLVRLFGLDPANAAVELAIDGIDVAEGKLSTTVSPAVANGSLSILGKANLTDAKWIRAKVLGGASATGGEVSLGDAALAPYRFFKLRVEEGAPAQGTESD